MIEIRIIWEKDDVKTLICLLNTHTKVPCKKVPFINKQDLLHLLVYKCTV